MIPLRGGGGLQPAAVLVFASLAALGRAEVQGEGRTPRPAVDPYTQGDPQAAKSAGYVSFGPFLWGDDHTSERVQAVLGGEPLIWVETAHFRLGSSLDEYDFPSDRIERKKLEGELARLKERLSGLKGKVKKLDPWLRLHLYALRLEDLYSDFLREFALEESEFPGPAGARPMGRGPYLGMADKFTVLLLEKKSALARYTSTYCEKAWEASFRYYFTKSDGLFCGLSYDALEGELQNDLVFHYALVFLVTQNLYGGFRGYDSEGPVWWQEGLARWFARKVDPRCLLYTAGKDETLRDELEADWEPKVRARVGHAYFPSVEEMLAWKDPEEWEFSRHMMAWSRVDFVLRRDRAKARALLMDLREPIPWSPERPREELLAERSRNALQSALGKDLAAFDREWAAWVFENYAKR